MIIFILDLQIISILKSIRSKENNNTYFNINANSLNFSLDKILVDKDTSNNKEKKKCKTLTAR